MSKNNKERVAVWLPCKAYVKSYLLNNFNRPDEDWPEIVNLSNDRVLHDALLSRLTRKTERYDKRIKGSSFNSRVAIEITRDEFYRNGWALTQTELMKYNALLESRVKSLLHTYVSILRVTGMSYADCIRRFRSKTHISELEWDTDSIRKELYRNSIKIDQSIMDDFLHKIEQKVWCVLQQNGTITEQGKNSYEEIDI